MNIGIDIDGVLLDTEDWFRSYAHIYDLDHKNSGIVNPQEFLFQRQFDWDDDTVAEYIRTYGIKSMEQAPLKACARVVLDRLREAGHKLIIITARGKWGQDELLVTKQFLDNLGFEFDKVYLNIMDKATICKQENIDYMIDDSPYNVHTLRENGIKTLYFRDVNREKITEDNVFEVNSWGEILRFINNVNKNTKE